MIGNKKYLPPIFLFNASALLWIPLLTCRYTCSLQDSPQLSACLDADTWNTAENHSLVYLMQFNSHSFNIRHYAPRLRAKPWDRKFHFQIHQICTAAVKDIKLCSFGLLCGFLLLSTIINNIRQAVNFGKKHYLHLCPLNKVQWLWFSRIFTRKLLSSSPQHEGPCSFLDNKDCAVQRQNCNGTFSYPPELAKQSDVHMRLLLKQHKIPAVSKILIF